MAATERSTAVKEKGNALVKTGAWEAAAAEYARAIDLATAEGAAEVVAACYMNRALCWNKLRDNGRALDDLSAALAVKPAYAKALYKRGKVLEEVGKFTEALRDLRAAKRLEPAYVADAEIDAVRRSMVTMLVTMKAAAVGKTATAADVAAAERRAKAWEARAGGSSSAEDGDEGAFGLGDAGGGGGGDGVDSDDDGGAASDVPAAAPLAPPPPPPTTPSLTPAEYAAAIDGGDAEARVEAPPGAAEQRFHVARFLAQYTAAGGGLQLGRTYCLLPAPWWRSWTAWVGGFSHATDVDPCLRLLAARGTMAFAPTDDDVLAAYPALATAAFGDLPPGVLDSRGLVAPQEAHIAPLPPAFIASAAAASAAASPAAATAADAPPAGAPSDQPSPPAVPAPALFLRSDAVETVDFELVGWQVGEMLSAWYGRRGPLLRRATAAASDGTVTVDLFPERHRYDGVGTAYAAAREAAAVAAAAAGSATGEAHECAVCGAPSTMRCTGCRVLRYCGRDCQLVHWRLHKDECKALARGGGGGAGGGGGDTLTGLVGLYNLGNTCFMNSALQALSACWPLTAYFLRGAWRGELNVGNAMGTGGKLATAYADLMRDLWLSKGRGYAVPSAVKRAVGGFHDRFAGFAQQDAQELLNYVLDGLHEDLNRVAVKPYVSDDPAGGRADAGMAGGPGGRAQPRNPGGGGDPFAGQLKSTLVCPRCERVSVKYDAFHMLSLPLPTSSKRTLLIRSERPTSDLLGVPRRWAVPDGAGAGARGWVDAEASESVPDREGRWVMHAVVVDKSDKCRAIVAAMAGELGVAEERLVLLRERLGGVEPLPMDVELGTIFGNYDKSLYAFVQTPAMLRPPPPPLAAAAAAALGGSVGVAADVDASAPTTRVTLIIDHLTGRVGEAGAAWQPVDRAVRAVVGESSPETLPSIVCVPRNATVALARTLLARAVLPLVALPRWKAHLAATMTAAARAAAADAAVASGGDATAAAAAVPAVAPDDVSDGTALYELARALPLAVPQPPARGTEPHWLPSFDVGVPVGSTAPARTAPSSPDSADGRFMHLDAAAAASLPPATAGAPRAEVVRLAITWRGAWYDFLSRSAHAKYAVAPSLKRAEIGRAHV